MRAATYHRALQTMPLGSLAALTQDKPFVVLSPHPDDETLGAGGIIADASARGQHVEVVILTDGAGSHPHSHAFPPERLIPLRKQEVEQAGTDLGLPAGRITYFDLPDTQAPSSGPRFDDAVAKIGATLERSGARTLFTTWCRDPHCDHEGRLVWRIPSENTIREYLIDRRGITLGDPCGLILSGAGILILMPTSMSLRLPDSASISRLGALPSTTPFALTPRR